jgi:predicted DNA-binding transcriptional regulator AlpA
MGVAEVAARLGVSRSRAAQIVRERDFPEPAAKLIGMDVWETADVEEWITRRRPPPAEGEI